MPEGVESAWHLYILRTDHRDAVVSGLSDRAIGTSVHFIPLHLHSYYREQFGYLPEDFPVATAQFERAFSLPIYSSMTDDEVERVIHAVRMVVGSMAAGAAR